MAAALAACAGGLVWLFTGQATPALVNNANVLGGVAGVAALGLSLLLLWPRAGAGPPGAEPTGAAQPWSPAQAQTWSPVQQAVEHLAEETLLYWQDQAKARRITAPSPVSVRWRWAAPQVAVPAEDLQPALLTAGVVTRLREQLYAHLGRPARIVILGGPGAGKTVAMMLLLLDVLRRRSAGSAEPVPVWLTLGGWDPRVVPLREYAASVLERDYPHLSAVPAGPVGTGPAGLAQAGAARGGVGGAAELIRTGRVALFLDGLDELAPHLQGPALEVLDREAAGLPLVLTSRAAEYAAAVTQGRLWGAAVIDVLPVDLDHAAAFLLAEQLGPQRRRWQEVIDRLRADPDGVAARTLTTPLALTLARDVYTRADPVALLDTRVHPTSQALLRFLLQRSVVLAYPDEEERRHAVAWLSWIARRMGTGRDLRWWDLPTWMASPGSRLAAGVLTGLVVGVVSGVGLGAGSVWSAGAMIGTALAVGVGTRVALALGRPGEPRRLALRRPGRAELAALLRGPVGVGLGIGGTFGMLTGLYAGAWAVVTLTPSRLPLPPVPWVFAESAALLAVGAVVGLIVGSWLQNHRRAREGGPRALPAHQRYGGLVFGAAFGEVWGMVAVVTDFPAGMLLALPIALVMGTVSGFFFGLGGALIRLLSLPVDTTWSASPHAVLRADRRQLLLGGIVGGTGVALLFAAGVGLLLMQASRIGGDDGLYVVVTVTVAIIGVLGGGLGGGLGPGAQLSLAELLSRLRGRPVRFVPLLQTALDRQVLRQVGAVYQFRHAALQDLFAAPPNEDDPGPSTGALPSSG